MAGPRQTTLPLGDAPAPSTPRSDPPPPPPPDVAPLSAALEAALLRELARVHESDSWAHFGSRLRAPVFELVDSATRLGRWVHATRTIELARALVLERPWPDVVAVLQHEMAHQYVDEVLGVRDESAHGDTFRRVCAERGIDARAAGAPGPPAGASPEVDRVLGRVRKLLALAGSANQHEAEAAMQRAHELMLRHNVEVAAAVAAPEFEVRHVGAPRRRRDPVESAIIVLLIDCFFVKAIRVPVYLVREGTRATQYELSGTRANLDLALHVHDFLLQTAARLWTANRHDARIRSGHDRLAYQTGVIRGFHDKLRAERKTLAGTGLIWRGDARLDAFYHRRHPRLRSSRSTTRARVAHLAGREAGQRVVLH
ncbi:MAG: DUF2786 domain-containing protein, partial [Myxococcales bacterium]|nr:DUF2786 domain-containing protein [Myxococcales bacterium]